MFARLRIIDIWTLLSKSPNLKLVPSNLKTFWEGGVLVLQAFPFLRGVAVVTVQPPSIVPCLPKKCKLKPQALYPALHGRTDNPSYILKPPAVRDGVARENCFDATV